MNTKLTMLLRIVFGLFLLFFGLNKILNFMDPPPPPNEEAIAYWVALTKGSVNTMFLVAIIEAVAGLSLIINKYAALMMLLLMSVSINALLYHVNFDPASIVMAIVLLALNIIMLLVYKDRYKSLLKK